MATARLNTGASIPLLGFGTASSSYPPTLQIKTAVADALEVGYRHIDTASHYGSEVAVGEALADAFQAGTLTREEVFITSKAWPSEVDDVLAAIKRSLSDLKLDYLDLYLVHWPLKFAKNPPTVEDVVPWDAHKTWQDMEKCVELGLAKAIGVSNFTSKKVTELLKIAKIPPAVNQVEMHPHWQQKQLREMCRKVNIQICAWSPMGGPQTGWGSSAVVDHPVIKAVAEKHGKTPGQVALRWGVQQGVCVLPKSYNKERVRENFQIFGWSFTDEDLAQIDKLEQKRNTAGPSLPDGSMYRDPGLWDGEA